MKEIENGRPVFIQPDSNTFLFFTRSVTSSVIYYSTHTRENVIYLLNIYTGGHFSILKYIYFEYFSLTISSP